MGRAHRGLHPGTTVFASADAATKDPSAAKMGFLEWGSVADALGYALRRVSDAEASGTQQGLNEFGGHSVCIDKRCSLGGY